MFSICVICVICAIRFISCPNRSTAVLAQIAEGKIPPVILVGGSSDFLAEDAFRDLRDAIVAAKPGIAIEAYEAGSELAAILDSYRTLSLFASARLIVVPEVNAFVSAKELSSLYDKAVADWKSAKTDKKRSSSAAKLLHVLGLVGADFDMTDKQIADRPRRLARSRRSPTCSPSAARPGRKRRAAKTMRRCSSRPITRGGAPDTYPAHAQRRDSARIRHRRSHRPQRRRRRHATSRARRSPARSSARSPTSPKTRKSASTAARSHALRQRLGIERLLADKFSKEVPDLRIAVSEAERLATLAGAGGRVTAEMVEREVATVEGGARYEFGSLFTEGKIVEAIAKLRDLVAQARREDPKAPIEIQYGKFLFPLADEVRQMIGIVSFARTHRIDLNAPMNYNRFKDTLADRLGDSLKSNGLVRQQPASLPAAQEMGSRAQPERRQASSARWPSSPTSRSSGSPAACRSDLGLETFLLRCSGA